MSKKKNTKQPNVIDFRKHQEKKNQSMLYDAFIQSFDDMANICAAICDLIQAMRESAEGAVSEAGLNFANFSLTLESTQEFHRHAIFLLFEDIVSLHPTDDSDLSEEDLRDMLENEPFVLEWVSTSKNGVEYSAFVVLEQDDDDELYDNITVDLSKNDGKQEWFYSFPDRAWMLEDDYYDDDYE